MIYLIALSSYTTFGDFQVTVATTNVADMESLNVVGGQIDAMDTSDWWRCDSGIMNSSVLTENIDDCVGKSDKQYVFLNVVKLLLLVTVHQLGHIQKVTNQTEHPLKEYVIMQIYKNRGIPTKQHKGWRNHRGLQTYSTHSDLKTPTTSLPNMNNALTSPDRYLQQCQSTSTEPPVCKHVQTVQCKTKSASVLLKENYCKFIQTEVKKNLLPQDINSKSDAMYKSTGDSMNVPHTRGKGIENVRLMSPINEFDKCMSTTVE